MQAWTYLSYYSDLQQAFGTKFNSWKKAQQHWEEYGYAEGRAYMVEGQVEPSVCADEGGTCNCMGDITFGPKKNTDDPNIAGQLHRATFEEILQWNSVTIDGKNGADIACTKATFGDPLGKLEGQCYCEAPARRTPIKLANEGEANDKSNDKTLWEHAGCFTDKNERALEEKDSASWHKGCGKDMKDKCQAAAEAKGFSVFGIQYPAGNCECWMGNDADKAKAYGSSDKCDGKGNGGTWAQDLYVSKKKVVGDFKCDGYMFYTQKSEGGQADLLFEDAIQNYPFHILRPEVARKGFNCNNEFIGLDPVPGQQKSCWCDASKTAWVNVTEVEYYLATFKAQREAYVRQQELDSMQAQIEQAQL
jgi:hypothetical protein